MTTETSVTEAPVMSVATVPHWSATRLKSLLLCPRQFRYAYVDQIPAVPTAPLVFGCVVHETLLFIHQRQMDGQELPQPGETLLRFDALWQQALEKENPFFRAGAATPEQHTKLGHEILRSYLRSVTGTKPPLAAELRFEITVGDEKLCGVIDRIDEQEDGLVIVDFKSGARKLSPQEVERDLQLTIYAFAAQQLYGRSTARVAQYYLRDGTFLRSLRGPDDFAWLTEEILPHARRVLRDEQFPPRTGYWCNWCDYKNLCRLEMQRDALAQAEQLRGEI
jgi:putative RecB family exonuclease